MKKNLCVNIFFFFLIPVILASGLEKPSLDNISYFGNIRWVRVTDVPVIRVPLKSELSFNFSPGITSSNLYKFLVEEEFSYSQSSARENSFRSTLVYRGESFIGALSGERLDNIERNLSQMDCLVSADGTLQTYVPRKSPLLPDKNTQWFRAWMKKVQQTGNVVVEIPSFLDEKGSHLMIYDERETKFFSVESFGRMSSYRIGFMGETGSKNERADGPSKNRPYDGHPYYNDAFSFNIISYGNVNDTLVFVSDRYSHMFASFESLVKVGSNEYVNTPDFPLSMYESPSKSNLKMKLTDSSFYRVLDKQNVYSFVDEEYGLWFLIETENGETGWVWSWDISGYVELSPSVRSHASSYTSETYSVRDLELLSRFDSKSYNYHKGMVLMDGTKLLRMPDELGDVLEFLQKNCSLEILGVYSIFNDEIKKEIIWCKVMSFDGIIPNVGWITGECVDGLTLFGIATINDSQVRLRTKPNLDCDVWALLDAGYQVRIKDKSAKPQTIDGESWYWYKVESEGYPDGWVYGKYLDIKE